MAIAKEFKQSEFKNEYHKLLVNIIFIESWLSMKNQAHLKPFELTYQQYNILRILRGQHPEPTPPFFVNRLNDR